MEERKRLMILTYFFSIFANGINAHIANAHISDFLSENVWFIPFFTGKYLNFNGYWFYNAIQNQNKKEKMGIIQKKFQINF